MNKLLIILLISGKIFALTDDNKKPVTISANSQEFFIEEDRIKFNGEVLVVQGSINLNANELTIINAGNKGNEIIRAIGSPAKFKQLQEDGTTIYGFAELMEYDFKTKQILFHKNAQVLQDKNSISSNKIYYNLTSKKISAHKGKNTQKVISTFLIEDSNE